MNVKMKFKPFCKYIGNKLTTSTKCINQDCTTALEFPISHDIHMGLNCSSYLIT